MGIGAISALTDVTAAQLCRASADLVALTRTAPFAIITYLCNDSVPAAPTIETAYMQTGVRTTSYAGGSPPTGFPSAARVSNGKVTVTFASSYADEYGVTGALTLTYALIAVSATSAVHRVGMYEYSGNAVTVTILDDTAAAVSDPRVTLLVG